MKTTTNLLPSPMSRYERYLRIATGAVLIVLAIVVPLSWGWLGIYPLMTGLMGTKPIFKALGIGRHE